MKHYGIRITLTESNPMRLPHLLGPDWQAYRWYESEADRDRAYAEIEAQLPNYRKGDIPAQVLARVEKGTEGD